MDAAVVWLILAAVLMVAEVLTLTAVLGLLGAATLVAAGTAALDWPLTVQLIAFAAGSMLAIFLIRPLAARYLRRPQLHRFGVEALVGESAYVVGEVSDIDGRVRIGGEVWTARSYIRSAVIPVGTVVDVMDVDTTTALVYPREGTWNSPQS